MNEKQYAAFLGCSVIPAVIALIQKNFSDETQIAVRNFYNSKVYTMLEQEDLKLWHYSPLTLFTIYEHEFKTGHLVFPEEAA
jgi:hypothetical protein